MGRVTVCPKDNTLAVDYVLPPAAGVPALEQLRKERGRYFRPGTDLTTIRRDAARALLVRGFLAEPKLVLNGTPVAGPFTKMAVDGVIWWRVPIAEP
ncbi:MAG: hypothetical protein BWY76_01029 [bacterium ADurb.Bin429]|nr:MAG: hypothetical protein BWY76_01029 [bacterium ADurb.Bin429]